MCVNLILRANKVYLLTRCTDDCFCQMCKITCCPFSMFALMNMQYQAFLLQSVQDTGKNRLFFRTTWSETPLYCLYHTCCHLRTHLYWITPSPPTYTRNLQLEHSFFLPLFVWDLGKSGPSSSCYICTSNET